MLVLERALDTVIAFVFEWSNHGCKVSPVRVYATMADYIGGGAFVIYANANRLSRTVNDRMPVSFLNIVRLAGSSQNHAISPQLARSTYNAQSPPTKSLSNRATRSFHMGGSACHHSERMADAPQAFGSTPPQ
jgi:hypothetical protein